ncbi:ATPase, AAA family [Brevundimonas diminuta 470-4]|nr:ATPase, AAA family [Brevundimonas diminuta 470-4]
MSTAVLKPSFLQLPDSDFATDLGARMADLIDAAMSGDQENVRRVATLFAQGYKGGDQREVVGRIHAAVKKRTMSLDHMRSVERLPVDNKTRMPLAEEQSWPTTPLLLEDEQAEVLSRFVEEAKNAERLSEAGLASRCNLLLSGPPGTGKTFIAGHIASRLGLPFHVVRLDSMISSLLGDTAKNIRALFEYANNGPGFIFIDEIDAVAKKRDDGRELGEIKRVVNTLIQALDMLDERTVVIAATNHAHLLDPAIFRRFPYHIQAPLPDERMRQALWTLYLYQDEKQPASVPLAKISEGLSCSDIRELSLSARRTALIHNRDMDICAVAAAVLESEEGRLRLPSSLEYDAKSKRALTEQLNTRGLLTMKQVGLLTGVTRQAATTKVKRQQEKA